MQAFALSVYRQLTWALQPLVRLRLNRRAAKEPLYGRWTEERFGTYTPPASSGWIWIHAVSLGETRAAALLLSELREQIPGMKLLLTHGTATGRAEGAKLMQSGDIQVWQPWDSWAATQKFIAHFKPRIGIVMETEVWPNLCAAAKKASVPMILANARLNEKSQRQALRLAWLARPAYASFSQVLAQTDDDAQRLRSVGAREAQVLGNVKYDVVPPADLMRVGEQFKLIAPSKRVVLLTSSREGEETLFLEQIRPIAGLNTAQGAINSIASTLHEDIQWMIVPRHPQRFDEVQRLIEQAGLNVSRRSTWGDAPKDADVWLGDTMGEMTLYYALADIALLGGSFAPLGGQNLIEAIAAGCPVVMGPHTFNFDEACNTAEREGAALRCTDMAQAVALAARTVPNSHAMQKLKHQGEDWLYASRGASRQMATVIAQLLKP
jgi:3-deoxy-D-manno-octulosonic-acid transferase